LARVTGHRQERGAATSGPSNPARANDDGRPPADSEASLAPAVTRAVAVLDALAAEPGVAAGTSELSRRLGLPKSSIANICAALVEAGLLRRAGPGFRLGRRLAELGGAYLSAVDQVQEFYDACESLDTASEETMQLGILDGTEVTYLARHDGRQPIRLASEIGRRLPASCTAMGKAAMASLDGDELTERLRGLRWLPTMTAKSHRTVDSLMADLERVRARGYAIDDEETAEGVVCYAIAVRPRRAGDNPYGASVTLLKARATEERLDLLVADLRRLAGMLSDPLHIAQPTG
jgi:IclR family transcriptional regulator, blcABC operon repressor